MTRVTSDPLVEGEHGFEFVLELVAGAGFVGELEAERVVVLADLADDPLIGEFLAGAGEGVSGREFAGDAGIESGDHFNQDANGRSASRNASTSGKRSAGSRERARWRTATNSRGRSGWRLQQ